MLVITRRAEVREGLKSNREGPCLVTGGDPVGRVQGLLSIFQTNTKIKNILGDMEILLYCIFKCLPMTEEE